MRGEWGQPRLETCLRKVDIYTLRFLSLWTHSSQSVALCRAAHVTAYGWQLSQCAVQLLCVCVFEFRCDTERNRGSRLHFPPQFSDVCAQTDNDTHSLSHYANTSSHTLPCSQTRTSIIREGLSSYRCFFLILIHGGLCEQVWWPCLQNRPSSLSRGKHNQLARHFLNQDKRVCLLWQRKKYIINDFFCSGFVSVSQTERAIGRETHSTNTSPSDSQGCLQRLDQYFFWCLLLEHRVHRLLSKHKQ